MTEEDNSKNDLTSSNNIKPLNEENKKNGKYLINLSNKPRR